MSVCVQNCDRHKREHSPEWIFFRSATSSWIFSVPRQNKFVVPDLALAEITGTDHGSWAGADYKTCFVTTIYFRAGR